MADRRTLPRSAAGDFDWLNPDAERNAPPAPGAPLDTPGHGPSIAEQTGRAPSEHSALERPSDPDARVREIFSERGQRWHRALEALRLVNEQADVSAMIPSSARRDIGGRNGAATGMAGQGRLTHKVRWLAALLAPLSVAACSLSGTIGQHSIAYNSSLEATTRDCREIGGARPEEVLSGLYSR